jgi:hypothetical protein
MESSAKDFIVAKTIITDKLFKHISLQIYK